MNSSSKVTNELQAHLSKLKNKKSQLENLLRARSRLDFEIQKLKKSIAKDSKKETKLREEVLRLHQGPERYSVITESLELSDDSDPEEELKYFIEIFNSYQEVLLEVNMLLLDYNET